MLFSLLAATGLRGVFALRGTGFGPNRCGLLRGTVFAHEKTAKAYMHFPLRMKFAIVTATATALLIAFMAPVHVPTFEATVVNWRLELFITSTAQAAELSDAQLRSRYQKLSSINRTASNEIPVDATLLRQAQRRKFQTMADI